MLRIYRDDDPDHARSAESVHAMNSRGAGNGLEVCRDGKIIFGGTRLAPHFRILGPGPNADTIVEHCGAVAECSVVFDNCSS